jgi:fumarate reductase flavoprotein subunit
MAVLPPPPDGFELSTDVIVVGAGACGLTAALAARDGEAEVIVLERDPTPLGTTAMSTGLIPAAGTPEQAARGIEDSPDLLAQDILAKAKGATDADVVMRLAQESAETVSWLQSAHGAPLTLVEGFTYPGHTVMRMMGTPNRTGSELIASLQTAAEAAGAMIVTDARAQHLYADADGAIRGVLYVRPDGTEETLGCKALILATCGFAGDRAMVERWIPEIAGGAFHGHPGATGDAARWGEALGAALADMTGYQGHGGLAAGHAIPILWPTITEGGVQVNLEGRRFSNEATGYSEQAARVLAQPGKVAWTILDARIEAVMVQFDDWQDALRAGAIVRADSVACLATATNLPEAALAETLAQVEALTASQTPCPFGRVFAPRPPLTAPFVAARVTGALFHTQGGLVVDHDARVLRQDGLAFSNLFAGGGAARGVSGPGASGYLAGNGLLTATTLGKLAGRAAARQIAREQS